jgi:hypothetical protein
MPGLGASIPLLGGVGSGGGGSPGLSADAAAAIRFEDSVTAVKRQQAVVTVGLGLSDTQSLLRGVIIQERLALALAQVTNSKRQAAVSEALRFHETLLGGRSQVVTEGLGLADVQAIQKGVAVIEHLGLLEVLAPTAIYQRSISETLRLHDTLGRFFGAEVIEGLGLAPVLAGTLSFGRTVTERLGLADVVTPRMVLRVTAAETLEFSDEQALSMIFDEEIVENVEFAIGYVAPDGSFTTWAMNTRSGAVTEYSNYAFNSFGRIGDICYGASDSGLYKLIGDDDAGIDIVADIKSGFAQWAGTKLAMFKGVYLGTRGGGDFVLKLITGDDKTFIYSVNARDMATTKITLGKGLRARYFAFELVSTGQDFDLDTIEFVPLVSDRRV